MSRKVHRGELYYADLSPVVGSEQGGCRPVLVIQNNVGNHFSPTVVVAALSGRVNAKGKLPTQYVMRMCPGLKADTVVLLEQIRTIDKQRLQNYVGTLDENDIRQVDSCLATSLALNTIIRK